MKINWPNIADVLRYGSATFVAIALAGAHLALSDTAKPLKPSTAFDTIKDPAERSVALFQEAGKVINSPRCLNCHPADNVPSHGVDMRQHQPPVARGAGGMGVAGMRCITCHG